MASIVDDDALAKRTGRIMDQDVGAVEAFWMALATRSNRF